MAENAIYYDASMCTACKGCQVNCKQWNQLPSPLEQSPWTGSYESPASNSGDTWLRITFNETTRSDDSVGWAFGRSACQHCTDAACAEACPTGACHHTKTGSVAIDEEKCIGCSFCVAACPYDIPHIRERDGKSHKCWMCENRVANGLLPACVQTCPTRALKFGDRAEMLQLAKDRVAAIKDTRPNAEVYGETQMGGLHVVQVLPYGAAAHGMPTGMAETSFNWVERVLRPLTILGVLGVGGVALMSFIGGRGFKQEEALAEMYPEDYKAKKAPTEGLIVDEVFSDGGGGA